MSFKIVLIILGVWFFNHLTKCDENPSIVIIGAGPAGIAAATRLLKNNFTNIKVLEAENRIGGRIHSVKFGDAYVDLGAEWCHGEKDNIVYSQVKDLNILKHTNPKYTFVFSNGTYIDEKLKNEFFEFSSSLEGSHVGEEFENNCKDVRSVGECFLKNFNSRLFQKHQNSIEESEMVQGSFEWLWSFISSYDSPLDLNDLLLKSEYKICEGDLRLNWNGLGYKTILEVMMQKFPNESQKLPIEDKIILDAEVTNITNWQNSNKTIITTKDGSTFEADIVIVTTSVGVLKANHETMFQPRLPEEKVKAIASIGFGAIAKAVLHFPRRWWDEDISWVPIWSRQEKLKAVVEFPGSLTPNGHQWLNYLVRIAPTENNPQVLSAWFAGNAVPDIENLSDGTFRNGIMFVIHKFLGEHFNVTGPDSLIRSTWYSNPHFRGTYSYESVQGHHQQGAHRFQRQLQSPIETENGTLTLLFAGEATHPYYFSTVHGAIETGYREADRIIEFYSNRQKKVTVYL